MKEFLILTLITLGTFQMQGIHKIKLDIDLKKEILESNSNLRMNKIDYLIRENNKIRRYA